MNPQQKEIKKAITEGRILQTPANDEKLKYAIGDRVTFKNNYGVLFPDLKIIGYASSNHDLYKYGNRYFLEKILGGILSQRTALHLASSIESAYNTVSAFLFYHA